MEESCLLANNIVIDYYNHILDGMWLSQQKAKNNRLAEAKAKDKNAAGEEEAKVDDAVDVSKRPEDYMFSGFLAFAFLLGPFVPDGLESNRLLKIFDREFTVSICMGWASFPIWTIVGRLANGIAKGKEAGVA